MTNSIQRIIDNLISDSPSMSIWADLDGLVIDIQRYWYSEYYECTVNSNTNYFSTSYELANYLEQNYA